MNRKVKKEEEEEKKKQQTTEITKLFKQGALQVTAFGERSMLTAPFPFITKEFHTPPRFLIACSVSYC